MPHAPPLAARSANESFARLFKGGGVQGRRPCPRSAERGIPLMLTKDQEGGLRGKPYQGVSPFCSCTYACAPIRWEVFVALFCDSTPFLWCLPKETVSSRQRKALFLPRRLHHSRERYQLVDYTFLARLEEGVGGCLSPYLRRGRTGLVMAALRGRSSSRASLSLSGSALLQKRVSLGLHPVSLRKSKEMGWNGQDQRGLLHGERRTRKNRRPYRAAVFLFIPGACRRLSTRERWSISTARPG